ncbi:MAG: hypothetical protein HS049_02510 [Thaumarchaeota archaeon]|nr:hypothetical protein [Nitrososphaerota archaeon]
MVIKQKIDSVTNNIFFRISRIGFIKTTSNTVSSMFRIRGLKIAYITLMVLFTTGIVNALLEGSRYAQSGQPIIANFQAQTLAETVIFSASILCGTLGFVFISRATKQVTKGRTTAAYIISGLSLAFIGLIIGFFLVTLKGG